MDAMILGAGLGTRMRPHTFTLPKPLIKVGAYRLIEYHLLRLKRAGFRHVVINRSYLAKRFDELVGNGSKYDLQISYSDEHEIPLETGGGILKALPLINSDPFIIISADIWSDFDFSKLNLSEVADGCLVLVKNPPHHPNGDFILKDGQVKLPRCDNRAALTYSGIAKLRKKLFVSETETVFPLSWIFKKAIESQTLEGMIHSGAWFDVGTQKRLQKVKSHLKKNL